MKNLELEDSKYEFTLINKSDSGYVERLFQIYKEDKRGAYIYFNLQGRESFKNYCTFLLENKERTMVVFKQKSFGISKTKRIYSREKEIKRIIISKKGVFSVQNKLVKPISINEVLCDNIVYKESIIKRLPEVEWIFDNKDYILLLNSISKTTLNNIIKNKITNFKNFLKFIYKDYNPNEIINCIINYKNSFNIINVLKYYDDYIVDKNYFYSLIQKINKSSENPSFYLIDCLNMCKKMDLKFSFNTTPKKIIEKHNQLTEEMNVISMTLSQRKIKVNQFFYDIKIEGLELINDTKRLALEGKTLSHCVYSYLGKIESSYNSVGIFHIEYDGEGYTLELSQKFEILQFRGLRNKEAPKELVYYIDNELKRIQNNKSHNPDNQRLSLESLPF